MAVQKSKKSASKRDQRRRANRNKMHCPLLSVDPTTGEQHRRHHITEQGFYRGQSVINPEPVE